MVTPYSGQAYLLASEPAVVQRGLNVSEFCDPSPELPDRDAVDKLIVKLEDMLISWQIAQSIIFRSYNEFDRIGQTPGASAVASIGYEINQICYCIIRIGQSITDYDI